MESRPRHRLGYGLNIEKRRPPPLLIFALHLIAPENERLSLLPNKENLKLQAAGIYIIVFFFTSSSLSKTLASFLRSFFARDLADLNRKKYNPPLYRTTIHTIIC